MNETDVYHRNPNILPPMAVAGRGPCIIVSEDVSHAPIFDLSCGAAVTGLGHSCLSVKDAMKNQISNLAYVHSAQFTHDAIEQAASVILNDCHVQSESGGTMFSPFSGGAVTFFSGGAEAVEAAVKMAMQYVQMTEGDSAHPVQIVGRRHSYHGNSMFTLALGDHPRKSALKAAFNVQCHVERFDAYAPNLFAPEMNEAEGKAYLAACLRSLERMLQLNQGYRRRCVVVIETVGGTTIGIAPPTVEYLMGVRALCDKFDAVLIYDEILCANYRTGEMTAWQFYQKRAGHNIAPDIFVMGKGITAGYFPMSAVVLSKDMASAGMNDGKVWHTSTNQNHVIGCAALVAAFKEYDLYRPRIRELSEHMITQTMLIFAKCEAILGVDGVGLLWGIRFNGNKSGLHRVVKTELLAKGYTAYTDGDTINGKGNMLMFAPPFIIAPEALDQCARAICAAAISADRYER